MSSSTTSTNTNVLEGIACPRCRSLEPFLIIAEAAFTVTDDGTTDYRDVEWTSESAIVCQVCAAIGSVADFTVTGAAKSQET